MSRSSIRILSLIFVALYGSGFVGAKLGLEDAGPLTFLALRFGLVSVVLFGASRLRGSRPRRVTRTELFHTSVAGLFLLAGFSAPVFISLKQGLAPAVSALIIALQPLIVGVFAARLLGELIRPHQWLGLLVGFVGVAIVVGGGIAFDLHQYEAILWSVAGLFGLVIGNLYQKRYCERMDVLFGGSVQNVAAALLCGVLAVSVEGVSVTFTTDFVVALLWMSFIVSIGAISVLYVLLSQNSVSRVASLFYLVPVFAALTSFVVFGDTLSTSDMIGGAVVLVGVALANRERSSSPARHHPVPANPTDPGLREAKI